MYLQEFLGYEQILVVYWTLCYEIQFYIALILLLWLGQAVRSTMLVIAASSLPATSRFTLSSRRARDTWTSRSAADTCIGTHRPL